jgi:hypothetical protein
VTIRNKSGWFMVVATFGLMGQHIGAIEQPKFDVVERIEAVEIRRYPPHVVAQTLVTGDFDSAGNLGFRRLAGYIFGGNSEDLDISMTAPVALKPGEIGKPTVGKSSYWVTFTMPIEYTISSLPEPDSETVELIVIPETYVAVLPYRGNWSEKRFEKYKAQLEATLAKQNSWEVRGDTSLLRYDAPFVPWFLRNNEVSLEVVSTSPSPSR